MKPYCKEAFQSPFSSICDEFALKFDEAEINGDIEQTKALLTEAKNVLKEHDEPAYAPLFYSIGTSILLLRDSVIQDKPEEENPYTAADVIALHGEAVWYFRHALELLHAKELEDPKYKPFVDGILLILNTNLGNAMDFCSRKSFAMKYYRAALEISPSFGMALGNMGRCLEHYYGLISDDGHKEILFYNAFSCFDKALLDRNPMTYQEAKSGFERHRSWYIKKYGEDRMRMKPSLSQYSLGHGREEQYRKWCLYNHLFLNPLNDLPEMETAYATDSLQIGSITVPIEQSDPPFVFEMLNQIKEEYIYSRYLLFEVGHGNGSVHFADRETHLEDTLNYSSYSIRLENLKTAYRTLYSIFDRTAFLLNAYLELGMNERDVSFDRFFENSKFLALENENVALAAIHWIRRDFKEQYGDEDRPHTKDLKTIRNALEHKFIAIHIFAVEHEVEMGNDYIRRITDNTLYKYTMDLIQIIREVVIELTMIIHIEEQKRHDPSAKVFRMELTEYADEFKI